MTPHTLLFYDYVEDIVERRAPHRAEHLALIQGFKDDGRLVMAGAVGDPPHGGLFVFADEDGAAAFVEADPYVKAGLVTSHRFERWNVV
jgi:uncharacterized protein